MKNAEKALENVSFPIYRVICEGQVKQCQQILDALIMISTNSKTI